MKLPFGTCQSVLPTTLLSCCRTRLTCNAPINASYNDQSVLENFHVAETFALGLSDEAPLFVSMERDMYRRLRAVVVSMVLATVRRDVVPCGCGCGRYELWR